jgi:hypothetical protein
MDEQRFRELETKRDTEGLSHEEANELGRMMAEREGRPYANAENLSHPETPDSDEQKPPTESQLVEHRRRAAVERGELVEGRERDPSKGGGER